MDHIALVIEQGILTDCEGKYVCGTPEPVIVPEGVAGIGEAALQGSRRVGSLVIPGSVRSIGDLAFECCDRLEYVVMLEGVKAIGYSAFAGCDELTIHAPTGSYAEGYARANGISFEAI